LIPGQEAPADAAALWQEAQEAMSRGDYETAEQLLKQYIILEPTELGGKRELARLMSWQGRYDEALKYYDQCLAEDPGDLDTATEKARVLGWQGRFPEAEAEARRVVETEPEHVEGNLVLAALLEWQGRSDEAGEVYAWVLKLDPDNETARKGRPVKETGLRVRSAVEWDSRHTGDNQDFLLLATRLGWRFIGVEGFSLKLFGAGAIIDDASRNRLYGAGGGAQASLTIGERLRIDAEAEVLDYVDAGNLLDIGGRLNVGFAALPSLYLGLRFHTSLYGPIAQSLATMEGEVRHYSPTGYAYFEYGVFSVYGEYTVAPLVMDSYDTRVVSSGMLTPRFKLVGRDHRLYAGYKLWFTGHSDPAPSEYGYWSPAQYYTHQHSLSLGGTLGQRGSYDLEVGGGMGHEYEPVKGEDSEFEQAARWTWFPVASAGGGIKKGWTERFETELRAWTVFSRRELEGGSSEYILWNVDLNVLYRF